MMEGKIKPCRDCGVDIFVRKGTRKFLCSACRAERQRSRVQAWCEAHSKGVGKGGSKWVWSDENLIDRTPIKHEDISGDERKARAVGLTYGQWRAMQRT